VASSGQDAMSGEGVCGLLDEHLQEVAIGGIGRPNGVLGADERLGARHGNGDVVEKDRHRVAAGVGVIHTARPCHQITTISSATRTTA
jgi:hypothetical protein